MPNRLYKQWGNIKSYQYLFLQELDTFLRNNNIKLDIYETNPNYAIRSAFEHWLSNNEEVSQFDNWKDAFYAFFYKNINNELYFSKGYEKIYVLNLKDCVEGLVDYLQSNQDDFLPRIKNAIDYIAQTEDKEAFDATTVSKYIYHIENTIYNLIYEKNLPIHIEKNIKYRDEINNINQYGYIYTVDDFFQDLVTEFYEHLPIIDAVQDEDHYFYKFIDKDARAFTIKGLYPKTYGLINNALEIILAGKNRLRISKNIFNKVLELANDNLENSQEISFVALQILLYDNLKYVVKVDPSFKYFSAIQSAFYYFKDNEMYIKLSDIDKAVIEGKLLEEFRNQFDEFANYDDAELYCKAENFLRYNLQLAISNFMEKNIVKSTCKELGITYKELGEAIGYGADSLRNIASKIEASEQLTKVIELYKENITLKTKLQDYYNLKETLRNLTK